MEYDEIFLPSLIKLGQSLTGSSGGSSSSSSGSSSSSISERTTCIVTLLRVLDNILAEHNATTTTTNGGGGEEGVILPNIANKNARLRKLKLSGGPFYTRVGQYDGGIDFLIACGFSLLLLDTTITSTSTTTTPTVVEQQQQQQQQLKLLTENEHPIRLFNGRCQLILFAQNVLHLSPSHWPPSSYMISKCTQPQQQQQEKTTTKTEIGGEPSSLKSVNEDEDKIMLVYSSPPVEMNIQQNSSQHSAEMIVGCCSTSSSNDVKPASATTTTTPATSSATSSSSTTTTTTPSSEKVVSSPPPPPPCTTTHQSSNPNISVTANSALKYYNSLQLSRIERKEVDDITNDDEIISDNLLNEIDNELNGMGGSGGSGSSSSNDDESFFLDYNDGSSRSSQVSLDRGAIIDDVGAVIVITPHITTTNNNNMDVHNPIVTVCNYEYDSSNDTEERIVGVIQEHETIVISSSSSHTNNINPVILHLEQSKRQVSVIDEDKQETVDDLRNKMNNMMIDTEHNTCQSAAASLDPTPSTKESEQSPLMVQNLLDLTTDVDYSINPSSSSLHVSSSSAKGCKNPLFDDLPLLCASFSSTSDMLSDLDSEFNQQVTEFNVQQQLLLHASDYNSVHDKNIRIKYDHKQDEREDIPNDDHHHHIHPNLSVSSSSLLLLPTQPPLDNVLEKSDSHHIYKQFFNDIPLPEGEFSSATNCDDTEDARKYRMGFQLCHQLLFSLWSSDSLNWEESHGITKTSSTRPYAPASSFAIDPTIGLTDLRRHRQIWEDEVTDGCDLDKPLMLIPLDIVYASWAWFLRLNKGGSNNRKSEGDMAVTATAAAVSGKMYLWIMSNHHHLSKIDDVLITSTHPTLPETSVNVCNYVCKSLRDIGLISIYSAGTAVGETSKSAEYFLGINDDNLFLEGMPRKLEDIIPILLLNDVELLHECHGVLFELVCPKLHHVLGLVINTDNVVSTNSRWTCWYSCRHAVKHLIVSARLEEAKLILSDTRYILLRLRNMGLLVGTAAHCRDCSAMALILSQSADRLNKRSDSIVGWSEEHYRILCSVSSILRKKAGDLSHDQNDSRRRTLQVDVGNAMQMIGKCIADIGIYRVQEVEHYEEALALMTESYGGDQNHESLADILYTIGCHHQKYYHFKYAQKSYEQALKIYKVTLGYEHPCVARVLHNIGVMYHAMNDNETALKCLKKCLSIRLSQLGEVDLSVADSYGWIGKIHREKKSFTKALECFVRAHKIKVDVLGKAHAESAEVLHNIGIVYDDLGMLSQSLSSFRETLLIRLANVSGAYDIDGISDVCETLDCIANVYRVKGENQKALQFFQQCLKRRLRLLSITSSSDETLVSLLLQTYEVVIMLTKLQVKECENDSEKLNEIGKLLVDMGSLQKSKALTYFQEALQLFEQTKDYKQVSNTLLLIGMIHVKKLDNQEAYKCFQDSLVKRRVYSKEKDTAEIAETMHNIGNCEAKDGRFDESLRSFREALRIKNKICPSEVLSIAKTEHCMGLVMLQLGNLDAAHGFFEKSLKVRRALLSNDHLDISFSLHSLGKICFHQDRTDKAIACLEEALNIKKSKLSDKHMSLAETRHLLASLYIKNENFEPVIDLLLSALVAYRGSRDCDILKSDVLDLLGRAFARTGDIENSIQSYERSLKIKTILVGADSSPCSNVLMEIGKLKSLSNDIDGALIAFKEVKRIQKKIYRKDDLRNADLLIQVGLIQDRLKNHGLALRCFEEALRIRRKFLNSNHMGLAEALVHVGKMHQCHSENFKSLTLFKDAVQIYQSLSNGDMMVDEYVGALHLLGLAQMKSGDSENALYSLETCLALQERSHGSESDQWSEVAYDLGLARIEAGLTEAAVILIVKYISLQRGCVEIQSNLNKFSTALVSLGKIYLKQRRVDDAMACFEEALDIRKQQSSDYDDNNSKKVMDVSEVLFQIGGVRESKKQYLESLVCYEEALKLRFSIFGEDEDTANIVYRIGEVRRIRGQHDLAMQNFTRALDMYKSSVGEAHLSVADCYHSLGYVCDAKCDVQKAMQNHREGLSVRKIILGGDHVKIATSFDDIAAIYQKQHEHEKALRCLKEALRIRKLRLGSHDIEIGKTLFGMGIIFATIGDTSNAMGCYNASLEISSSLGSHPKLEAQTLHQIGCLLAESCNYNEALNNWRTCLSKYREGGLKDDHYMVACTLGNIEMAMNALTNRC